MNILDILGKRPVFYDGATGTYLQKNGLEPGALPELMNLTAPETIKAMHSEFIASGSDIILTNTFGANSLKFAGDKLEEIIKSAVELAKQSRGSKPVAVSYDIGPTGKLLEPMGELSFDDAYNLFAEQVILAEKYGVDMYTIETMTDLYETKVAVLAVKENSTKPVFVTTAYDTAGKLLSGSDAKTVVSVLEGLGVDALGINCGTGPYQMDKIVGELLQYSSIPVIVNPNAGLPRSEGESTVFDITATQFASKMKQFANKGVYVLGGCCGTTGEHIKKTIEQCSGIKLKPIKKKTSTIVSSYAMAVEISADPIIIGERINPTGKPLFREALKNNDINYILNEGITQQEKGAHILDVNVGLPDIDEPTVMVDTVKALQSIIGLPLQIDTSDTVALERGLRIYNGKAMVNSVNGKSESLKAVLPLVKKYGGVVVGLTLDESGIPVTAKGRFDIAKKIIDTAKEYGIDKKDIVIDPLALTISSDSNSGNVALESLRLISTKLKVNTVMGVSNISFGLPNREKINANFYTLAMHSGLTSGIINPSSTAMMDAYASYRALKGYDKDCLDYIGCNSGVQSTPVTSTSTELKLEDIILKGLRDMALESTKKLLALSPAMEIINTVLIPALDIVGKRFESGEIFLPQLLMSAETAKIGFEFLKDELKKSGNEQQKKGKIILATVKGDIHDIGKNIVKVLLENYGFDVIDLGKDVAPELILQTAKEQNVKLIGLSALMTTTVVSMKKTIELFKESGVDATFMVGGAVLNKEYAKMINADFYGKDAQSSVNFANNFFNVKG